MAKPWLLLHYLIHGEPYGLEESNMSGHHWRETSYQRAMTRKAEDPYRDEIPLETTVSSQTKERFKKRRKAEQLLEERALERENREFHF